MTSPRKIALLGGSGFIGTRLTSDLLRSGHDVVIGDISPSAAYPHICQIADVRDTNSLESICGDCDTIINLAAAHRDDVRPQSLYYDINVTGAHATCDVAEKFNISTIIFTSSAAVYGHQDSVPDESSPHQPIGPYGETKSQAEAVYKDWQSRQPDRRSLVIIRPTVVFGPGNRGNVHVLMDQITKGRFLMIGSGKNKKSMAFVTNVAAFINHSLSLRAGTHIFNYVDKPDMSMSELVKLITTRTDATGHLLSFRLPKFLGLIAGSIFDLIASITGKNFPISRVRIEKFCAETVFKADKVKTTGFIAPVDLKTALIQTIDAEFSAQKTEGTI